MSPTLLEAAGWSELLEEASTGEIAFAGGALRMTPTPAMTLFDVDGVGAARRRWRSRAARAVGAGDPAARHRRLDRHRLPDLAGKAAAPGRRRGDRRRSSPPPFERTAVNGFGFLQIVRPRPRASLPELLRADPIGAAARAALRRLERVPPAAARRHRLPAAVIARSAGPPRLAGGTGAPHGARADLGAMMHDQMPDLRQAADAAPHALLLARAAATATCCSGWATDTVFRGRPRTLMRNPKRRAKADAREDRLLEHQLGPLPDRHRRALPARGRARRPVPAGDEGDRRRLPGGCVPRGSAIEHVILHGQRMHHGVAIVSRVPVVEDDRLDWQANREARHVGRAAAERGPAGERLRSRGRRRARSQRQSEVRAEARLRRADDALVGGAGRADDPGRRLQHRAAAERRVEPQGAARSVVSHTPVEVEALDALKASNDWVDLGRHFHPAPARLHTWWSYRSPDWTVNDRGRRLDHQWATRAMWPTRRPRTRSSRSAAAGCKPSDHVPIMTEFDL